MAHLLSIGHAYPNHLGQPSHPIDYVDDLRRAIRVTGRSGHDEAGKRGPRRYIMRRATALGRESMIPDSWDRTTGALKTARRSVELLPLSTYDELEADLRAVAGRR